jgi:hypothetical protein
LYEIVPSANPGANPTTSIYNASVVKFYNATGSLARFGNKNISFYFEKRSSLLQLWRCSCKFKSRRIGSWFQWLVLMNAGKSFHFEFQSVPTAGCFVVDGRQVIRNFGGKSWRKARQKLWRENFEKIAPKKNFKKSFSSS